MLKHRRIQLRLLTVALIVSVVGFAGLLAFTSETSGEGGLVSPVAPLPGSPPIAISVDSGTIGSGECFVSIQKVFEGPLQVERPVIEGETPPTPFLLREVEIINIISACAEQGNDPEINSSVETFIVECTREEDLTGSVCTTTRSE
ncbi:MAG: hypothetical protein IIB14_06410 [Chloroflexi bacterium]|nr:hypothetical protein [Chloroflexota bacterium]